MSGEPGEAPPLFRARLNPFVFPSDTTFRFLLLLVAVVGANLYIWNWLHTVFALDPDGLEAAYNDCKSAYEAATAAGPDSGSLEAASNARTACVNDATSALPWWMIGGTVLLLVVAATIMFLLPTWIVRRRSLRPLTREDAPAVVDELAELARESGVDEEPRWLWNPLDPSPTGLAFGRPGSHAVALNGGLVTRQLADPPAFRAVVRHELAHLRNHDVDLTYATVALWYAFLLVGVLPFAITVADEGTNFLFSLTWRVLALAIFVYLTRNAVLRAREVYADVRASVHDGRQGALRRILGALPTALDIAVAADVASASRSQEASRERARHAAALPARARRHVRGRCRRDDRVRERLRSHQHGSSTTRSRPTSWLPPCSRRSRWARSAWACGVARGVPSQRTRRPPATWPVALALAAGLLVGPELALDRIVSAEGSLLRDGLGAGARVDRGPGRRAAAPPGVGPSFGRGLDSRACRYFAADRLDAGGAAVRERHARDLHRRLLPAVRLAAGDRDLEGGHRDRARRGRGDRVGGAGMAVPAHPGPVRAHRAHTTRRLHRARRALALPARGMAAEARPSRRSVVGVPRARRSVADPAARARVARPLRRRARRRARLPRRASRPARRAPRDRRPGDARRVPLPARVLPLAARPRAGRPGRRRDGRHGSRPGGRTAARRRSRRRLSSRA